MSNIFKLDATFFPATLSYNLQFLIHTVHFYSLSLDPYPMSDVSPVALTARSLLSVFCCSVCRVVRRGEKEVRRRVGRKRKREGKSRGRRGEGLP